MNEILAALGVDIHNLVAGFSGGIAVSFALKKSDPWDILGGVIVGGLCGNWASSIFIGTEHGTAAFFAGVIGMPLCQLLVMWIRKKMEALT